MERHHEDRTQEVGKSYTGIEDKVTFVYGSLHQMELEEYTSTISKYVGRSYNGVENKIRIFYLKGIRTDLD